MDKISEQLIKRNEKWIALSRKQIQEYQERIEEEEQCIRDLAAQNRELKERK